MSTTQTFTRTLYVWTCPVNRCGVIYGIEQEYADRIRRDGGTYYCPNGHRLGWDEDEADRQRKRAEAAERDVAAFRAGQLDAQREAAHQRNVARAERGAKTKLRKRIANGVCPCCHRQFAQLAAHIRDKHPDYPEAP